MKRLEYLRRRPSETKGKAELCATSRVLKLKKKRNSTKEVQRNSERYYHYFFLLGCRPSVG